MKHSWEPTSILGRALAFLFGIVLLVLAFFFSLVVFAVALSAVVVAGAYLWWQTRDLRKAARQHDVIEGEVVRREDGRDQP